MPVIDMEIPAATPCPPGSCGAAADWKISTLLLLPAAWLTPGCGGFVFRASNVIVFFYPVFTWIRLGRCSLEHILRAAMVL
ncbi:hypothetical protein C2845_PM12G10380 [Panicum miliaceum]|uniref:Uncharacterized protein n=1 Tax=Panicum miliaceum TaxID=4540 RepID=A0A3L6QK17_PANMI|nr:hypothetical protein C2845_PM12G10380 [Panicum miliaceum]